MNSTINEKEILNQVKNSFDVICKIGNNDEHLKKILSNVKLEENDICLDLGTGNGYVAFEIANKFHNSKIIGIDIVEKVIANNNKIVMEDKLDNIKFKLYNGVDIPLPDNSVNYIITRFALHHFPRIDKTISELNRILKKNGKIFIIDCVPNVEDNENFINKWMKIIKDGHVKFYTQKEYVEMFKKYNIIIEKEFYTDVICKRTKNLEYENLLKNTNKKVVNSYLEMINDNEIWLKEKVWNVIWKRGI